MLPSLAAMSAGISMKNFVTQEFEHAQTFLGSNCCSSTCCQFNHHVRQQFNSISYFYAVVNRYRKSFRKRQGSSNAIPTMDPSMINEESEIHEGTLLSEELI